MIKAPYLTALGALAAATAIFAVAQAHTQLASSSPVANSVGAAPHHIALTFSEAVEPRFSGFEVTKGTAKVTLQTTVSPDKKTFTGVPTQPLTTGAYRVAWHAAGKDGHRMEGNFSFTVR